MSEKDEIAREILPFLMDLFPGVSVSLFITCIKYFSLAIFAVIGFVVFYYTLVRIYVRRKSERYIKTLRSMNSIEGLDLDEDRKKTLKNLVLQCVIIGRKIDFHTNRKNNSKNVSHLVWEMCSRLGMEKLQAILYSCAAMVYDIGFLDVNGSYFHAEVLSTKEKKLLRAHIMGSYEHLLFVPEEYRSIFFDASMFHHENYNGTGYPEGLSQKEIPEIAQMIRITESFVALTSNRSYRKVYPRDEAMEILKVSSFSYNPEFLGILEKIV